MSPAVLYVDNHLLVVNKPPGLLSQGDRTGDPSVQSLGKEYVGQAFDKPGNVYLALPHRLDRPASGVMVLARTTKAMRRFSKQFRERRVAKQYVALVEGCLVGNGQWDDYLVREGRRMSVVERETSGAVGATLTFKVQGHAGDNTVVEICLVTGRRHQIRCQFAHRGFPLVGDFLYGARCPFDDCNLALHAYRLGLTHPTSGEWLVFEAPFPAVWHDFGGQAIECLLRDDRLSANDPQQVVPRT